MKKDALKNAYPSIPYNCHQALVKAVDGLAETNRAYDRRPLVLAVILCLILVLGGTAIAVTQLDILSFGRLKNQTVNYPLSEAESLVGVNLAQKTIHGVTIKIKEAYYDGRVLEVLCAIAPAQKEAQGKARQEIDASYNSLLEKAGLDLQIFHGYISINGQRVSLRSANIQPGNAPGEHQYLVDSELEYEDEETGAMMTLCPKGKAMDISIGIIGSQMEEAISFTLPVPEKGKWSLPLPPPTQVNGCTLTFTDLYFSPVSTYIEYAVQVPASMAPQGSLEEIGMKIFDLQGRFADMGIYDAKGESMGIGKAGGGKSCTRLDNGDIRFILYTEYTARSAYPDVIYLSVDGAMVPIPMTPARQ